MAEPLGPDWCEVHLDAELQKYVDAPPPVGFGLVYAIVKRQGNQKAYIGKTAMQEHGVRTRWYGHKNGTYGRAKSAIHNAIQKNGVHAFRLLVLALVPIDELSETEKQMIVTYGTVAPCGYNLRAGGDGGLMSEEAKQNMKDAWRRDPDVRAKRVAGIKRSITAETLRKMHDGYKNMSPESRKKAKEKERQTKIAQGTQWRVERDTKALHEALPHEPNVDCRQDGVYYRRPDGSIRRWSVLSRRFCSVPIPNAGFE